MTLYYWDVVNEDLKNSIMSRYINQITRPSIIYIFSQDDRTPASIKSIF